MSKEKFDKDYVLVPMSEITDEARIIAKRWYDGVSEMNDIREKHKLASDIMNYAKHHAIEFMKWLTLNGWEISTRHPEKWYDSSKLPYEYLSYQEVYNLFLNERKQG